MPVYEYRCSECSFEVTLLQKLSDAAPTCCDCNSKKGMKKLMSSSSFLLMGSGWAKDGYAK